MKSIGKKILIGICILAVIVGGGYIYLLGCIGMGPLHFIGYNRKPFQIGTEQNSYSEITFEIGPEGEMVRGMYYAPDDIRQDSPMVIISHGYNSSARLLASKAKSLAQAGIPALVYDFRGGSSHSLSDGESIDLSVSTETSDLNAVIAYVKTIDFVDERKICLLGESFGGLITAHVSANRDDINKIVLCFPAFHAPESSRTGFASKDEIPKSIRSMGLKTGRKFWSELYDMDIYKEIPSYKGEVLIFHGTEDPAVDPAYSRKAVSLYRNAKLVIIDGAGHGFNGKDEIDVYSQILEYLKEEKHSYGQNKEILH